MQPMFSNGLCRVDLNGPTMGTRWHVQVWTAKGFDPAPLQAALQKAVNRVDAQMSLWSPHSDLCALNSTAIGTWLDMPTEIRRVLTRAIEVEAASGGAFDIAVGQAVAAWGFGPKAADPVKVSALLQTRNRPKSRHALEIDGTKVRRVADVQFDLNGIAKGFGVDRLIEVAADHEITALTAGIDGDLRCVGTRPDGSLWPIAIEQPDYNTRAVHSMMELSGTAIATSGDYRHWVDVGTARYSHTMNPDLNAPLMHSPASVTVLAPDCMTADAWATALMVLDRTVGPALARAHGIQAMYLDREARTPTQTETV